MSDGRGPLLGVALLFLIAAVVASFRPWPESERVAPSANPASEIALGRDPFMGVACPVGNDIRCDRVKLAVWVSEPARFVAATIGGLIFDMGAIVQGDEPLGLFWQGILQPAGLLDGPLSIDPKTLKDGRWLGENPPTVNVRIEIVTEDERVTRSARVTLRPGYG